MTETQTPNDAGEPPPFPRSEGETTARALASEPDLAVGLHLLAGESGLDRPLRHPRCQKSGLALAGHYFGVVPTRVQVLGETELSFVEALSNDARGNAVRGFFSLGLSCVVVTRNKAPPRALVTAAEASGTPFFQSAGRSSRTVYAIHDVLDARLAPTTTLHGVLVDVFGVGVLLLGKSGIGKSECAIELVLRGHRLVADDVVRCDWRPPGNVYGQPAGLLRHHLEVRGLGILNVEALFGVTAVRPRKRIDLVVRLVEWDDATEFDRLGLDDHFYSLLGAPIRELTVPVRPGRDMGSILEIAARNELLRKTGKNTSRELLEQLEGALGVAGASTGDRAIPHCPDSGEAVPGARGGRRADGDTLGQRGFVGSGRDARKLGHRSAVLPPASSGTLADPAGAAVEPEGGGVTWSEFRDRNGSNESSAWIPRVRPIEPREEDGDEDGEGGPSRAALRERDGDDE